MTMDASILNKPAVKRGGLILDGLLCALSTDGIYLDSATVARIIHSGMGKLTSVATSEKRKESLKRMNNVGFWRVPVRSITGTSNRYMVVVWRGVERLMADAVTGSLYGEDGACLSSLSLHIVGRPVLVKNTDAIAHEFKRLRNYGLQGASE